MAELPEPEIVDIAEVLQSYADGDIDLICVLGPTASGKTRYAVWLAKEIDRLLSSGYLRRGPDGKPVKYGHVPYHLIDIAEAGSKYNIYEYQKDFEKAYRDIVSRGCVPILCGGSGLYIEAATCGYSLPDVPADSRLRAELEKEETPVLIARLAALKPLHNSTDYDTRKRLIRALEIALYEASHPVGRTHSLPKKTYYIGTLVSRDERNAKIDRRLEARLQEGMTEEVQRLLDSGIPAEDLIYYGLEYKFITLYLTGRLDYQDMKGQLAIAIHQFAKRQMTWFRGMERRGIKIHWVRPV